MTAEKLIAGLRERGYSVLRSVEPATWVVIGRVPEVDPLLPWFQENLGRAVRPFEAWSDPPKMEYEVNLIGWPVEVGPHATPHELAEAQRTAIWEAAA